MRFQRAFNDIPIMLQTLIMPIFVFFLQDAAAEIL